MDRMSSGPESVCGLTLIELMIVLLILGITLALGGPAMRQLIYGMQVSSEISRLMGSVNLVRSEALRLNQAVTMCPSAMAETGDAVCGSSAARCLAVAARRSAQAFHHRRRYGGTMCT